MNTKSDNVKSKADVLKWIIVGLLFVGGFVANHFLVQYPWALRTVGWIVLVLIAAGIAFQTHAGRTAWRFFKDARGEMRKVVWPTRQETFQTTLIVIAMVIVLAIFLWAIDSGWMWVIAKLTA